MVTGTIPRTSDTMDYMSGGTLSTSAIHGPKRRLIPMLDLTMVKSLPIPIQISTIIWLLNSGLISAKTFLSLTITMVKSATSQSIWVLEHLEMEKIYRIKMIVNLLKLEYLFLVFRLAIGVTKLSGSDDKLPVPVKVTENIPAAHTDDKPAF